MAEVAVETGAMIAEVLEDAVSVVVREAEEVAGLIAIVLATIVRAEKAGVPGTEVLVKEVRAEVVRVTIGVAVNAVMEEIVVVAGAPDVTSVKEATGARDTARTFPRPESPPRSNPRDPRSKASPATSARPSVRSPSPISRR